MCAQASSFTLRFGGEEPEASVFTRFALMISGAAHLPLVPAFDWGDRAAMALGRGDLDGAVGVAIVDSGAGAVVHAGAWCGGAHAHHAAGLAGAVNAWLPGRAVWIERGVRAVEWVDRAAHPFGVAGFGPGVVIAANVRLGGDHVLRAWRWSLGGAEPELSSFGAAAEFVGGVAAAVMSPRNGALEWLTQRETEILDLIVRGHTVPEIGAVMERSVHTIHDHVKAIRRKTGFSSRGALVAAASGRRSEPEAGGGVSPRRAGPGGSDAGRV